MTASVDHIAVERAVNGHPPARLTIAERAAAVMRLTDRGVSTAVIAERLRITTRTVRRIRRREVAG